MNGRGDLSCYYFLFVSWLEIFKKAVLIYFLLPYGSLASQYFDVFDNCV